MQQIPEEAPAKDIREGIVNEIERVEADEEVKHLAAAYRIKVDEFLAQYNEIDPLDILWIRQDARLRYRDRLLDIVVRGFRLAVVALSGGKQTGPLLDLYLPEGLRAVTEVEPAAAEPAEVKKIMDQLEENKGDLATEWLPKLTAARDAVLVQAGERHSVENQQNKLDIRIEAKVRELQAERVELHGLLRGHFKHAPATAEPFFYDWKRPRRRKAPAPEAPALAPTP